MYRNLIAIIALFIVNYLNVMSQEKEVDYRPDIHGAIRGRWEVETESGNSRFQVRNARLSLDGKIAPSIDYFLQTDLCDRGSIKVLDVFGRFSVIKGLQIQAGQFRMPFAVDPTKGPQNYIFANRSFMGKQMCNFRKVGVKVAYSLPVDMPLLLEAGAFNAGGIGVDNSWSKDYAFSGRATLTLGEFSICAGAMGIKPDLYRINLYNGAVSWNNDNLLVAAEYMNEHYTDGVHGDAHSYCAYVDYHHPFKLGIFNQWSVQGRFDGITSHWSGIAEETEMPARNRVTLGGTLTYIYKSVFSDIRLNYEKYMYRDDVTVPEGQGDKVVVELVIRF